MPRVNGFMDYVAIPDRAVAPTPTSQAMAGLVFTNCANLSE